jgi:hypothetical protein
MSYVQCLIDSKAAFVFDSNSGEPSKGDISGISAS